MIHRKIRKKKSKKTRNKTKPPKKNTSAFESQKINTTISYKKKKTFRKNQSNISTGQQCHRQHSHTQYTQHNNHQKQSPRSRTKPTNTEAFWLFWLTRPFRNKTRTRAALSCQTKQRSPGLARDSLTVGI